MRWQHRKMDQSIGRIIHVHPAASELFYLRILLNIVRGATSYEHLRTMNGITYNSFQEACFVHGLLRDDREWNDVLEQASQWATGYQLR